MKYFCLCVFIIFLSHLAIAQNKPDTLFFENFNNTSLNRAMWNVEVNSHPANNEQQAYVDSTSVISQEKGMLLIKPIYHPDDIQGTHNKHDFISGRINTRSKFEFTYGTASAKIKMSSGAGLWPAFWALGQGKWPECGEIDMMETVGDSSWVSHAMHGPGYFGNTPIAYRYHFPQGVDVTQWHIYSVDWTADHMIFSVDGKVTYTVTRAMVEHFGRWAYDTPKYIILNFALGGGYPNSVNKVTSPYYGLSQSSVDKVKAGKAVMQVDWVLVTKN